MLRWLAILALWPGLALGAITVTDVTAVAATNGATDTTSTISMTAGDIAVLAAYSNQTYASAVAWAGGTPSGCTAWSLIHATQARANFGGSQIAGTVSVYGAIATGTCSGTAVVSGGAGNWAEVHVRIYHGAKTTGTVQQAFGVVLAGTGTTAPTLSPVVTATGSLLAFVNCDWNALAAPTAIAGDTRVWSNVATDTNSWIEQTAATSTTGATAVGASAPTSGLEWSGVAFELLVALAGTASTPTATPAPGSYATAQNVALSCGSPSPTIRYTTDGSTPTGSSSVYSSSLSLAYPGANVQAICQSSGLTDSAPAGFYYPIGHPWAATRYWGP